MRRLAIALLLLPALAHAKPQPWEALPLPPTMPEADTRGVVEVGGAKISYGIYGTGAPVILLHGGMGNADHWANQVPSLVGKLEVIAIDTRGHGRSTRGKGKITYDVMAADVLAVMDQLKLDKASLVGWSDGGEVALKLAINHPTRVDRLFVFGANYNGKGSKPRGGPPHETFNIYASKCRSDYRKLSATPKQYDALIDWLLPVWRNPMGITKDQLRSIAAPTLIADGDHDEVIVLAQLEEMAQLIPNARLEVFKDTSHFALWQDPAAFNKVLVEFLTSPAPSPPRATGR